MSGRNRRAPVRYTDARRRPQPQVRRRPTNPGYRMGPYRNPGYQMAPYQNRGYQQMPYQVTNNYYQINYQMGGYQSRAHAWQCPHVQRAISQHGLSNSNVEQFLWKLATTGCSIFASLVSMGTLGF